MPLNSNALTDLATAKAYLKIPVSETGMDNMIEMFINAASDEIEHYCDRKLKAQNLVEYHHGRGNNSFLPYQFPINSITELSIDNDSKFIDPNTIVDPGDYVVTDHGNSILYINQVFPNGYHNIKLTYNAGYAVIPSSLEHTALWIIAYYNRMREGQNIGRPNKSKEGESATYLQSLPTYILASLDKFKRSEFPNIEVGIWNI